MFDNDQGSERDTIIRGQIDFLLKQLSPQGQANIANNLIKGMDSAQLQSLTSAIDARQTELQAEPATLLSQQVDQPIKPQSQPEIRSTGNEEAKLQEIDKTIRERHIFGKFSGAITLHGQQLTDENFDRHRERDFIVHPPVSMWQFDSSEHIRTLFEIVRSGILKNDRTGLGSSFANSHVFSYMRDRTNPSMSRIHFAFADLNSDAVGRHNGAFVVTLDLPTDSLNQLLPIVKSNPDMANLFYEIATNGLDTSEATKRPQTTQLALIDLDSMIPEQQLRQKAAPDTSLNQLVNAYSGMLDRSAISYLNYSKPFGSEHIR